MTLTELQKLWRAAPFRPFVLHLADGRRLPVASPERLTRTGAGRTIAVCDEVGDGTELVTLRTVTAITLRSGRHSERP